jgi:hypothetical protein
VGVAVLDATLAEADAWAGAVGRSVLLLDAPREYAQRESSPQSPDAAFPAC